MFFVWIYYCLPSGLYLCSILTMDPTSTQIYMNELSFRILQCLRGIRTWGPQATGDYILGFMNRFCNGFTEVFKPALPSDVLYTQTQQATKMFAIQIAKLTIFHYKKNI